MAAGIAIETTFALENDPRFDDWPAVRAVEPPVLARLADTDTPRGPVAVMPIPPWEPIPPGDLLVLVEVSDPGNVGTIVRSAAAFELGVVIGPGTADPWSPKVLRAAAGAHFRTTVSRVDGPGELTDHRLVATLVNEGLTPEEMGEGPWAFLIGNESHGLDREWASAAHVKVRIPMPGGTESLNAGMAASIIAYTRRMGENGSRSENGPH